MLLYLAPGAASALHCLPGLQAMGTWPVADRSPAAAAGSSLREDGLQRPLLGTLQERSFRKDNKLVQIGT